MPSSRTDLPQQRRYKINLIEDGIYRVIHFKFTSFYINIELGFVLAH